MYTSLEVKVRVSILFSSNFQLEDEIIGQMRKSFNKYDGVNSTDDLSVGWDLMFIGVSYIYCVLLECHMFILFHVQRLHIQMM